MQCRRQLVDGTGKAEPDVLTLEEENGGEDSDDGECAEDEEAVEGAKEESSLGAVVGWWGGRERRGCASKRLVLSCSHKSIEERRATSHRDRHTHSNLTIAASFRTYRAGPDCS